MTRSSLAPTAPIVVIGSVTRDTLIHPFKGTSESLGGILYNTLALANLTDVPIVPVANVGYDVYDEVLEVIRPHTNVQTVGLRRTTEPNLQSTIVYVNDYGVQFDINRAQPVTFDQVLPFLDARAFMVTFPTGDDLRLTTLKAIAHVVHAPIHLDYHILSLGRDALGTRYLRKRSNWRDWLAQADVVQLNLFEASHLAGRSLQILDDFQTFAAQVLCLGPKMVAITRGADGSCLFCRNGAGGIDVVDVAAQVVEEVDATGCGDVYAAGFVVSLLETNDYLLAAKAASRVAAYKAGRRGLHAFDKGLRDALRAEDSYEACDRTPAPRMPADGVAVSTRPLGI